MVFISHGQDVLWSQEACWKSIFQGSGDSNVKISSFTAHHGGASGDTDLANSKETQSLRKYGCRQKCLDKSLVWLDRTPGVNYEEKLHNQLLILFKNVDFLLLISVCIQKIKVRYQSSQGILKIQQYSNLVGWEHALAYPFQSNRLRFFLLLTSETNIESARGY